MIVWVNRPSNMYVSLAGYPPPTLHWYKITEGGGRAALTDDDWHSINTLLSHGNFLSISERWYQLTIRNVRGRDLGDYVCEGRNRHGRGSATIRVYGEWCVCVYVCLSVCVSICKRFWQRE